MKQPTDCAKTVLLMLVAAAALFQSVIAQQQKQETKDDVVRVYTELVQTDVMVFDKQGRFVKDLTRDDFELRIDGKPRAIEFFERITAGSANEETQLAAARGGANATSGTPVPLDRGRTIFFYIDDLHLDLSGAQLTRRMLTAYIDREMGQNDQAAITSSSGQLGFLQQLTDNKSVLREAVEQIKPRATTVRDSFRPPMTEYQALLVNRFDRDVTDYFAEAILRETPGLPRDVVDEMVRNRAQQVLQQSSNITRATLAGLESLIKSSSALPGRKIIFFVSNGFFLENRVSDSMDRLRRVTSAAARTGAVIYSMDARGLISGLADASTDVAFDVSGRLERAAHGEQLASQDALNALAADTGGRALFNSNVLEPGMKRALQETSTYYLLAWKPDPETEQTNRFRKIEVRLARKSDLTVRVRSGFYNDVQAEEPKSSTARAETKTAEAELTAALTAPFPKNSVPVSVNLAHMNTPERGDLLSVSLVVSADSLTFTTDANGTRKAVVEVAGTVHNAKGQVGARFSETITFTAPENPTSDGAHRPVELGYTYPIYLKPGLYHARVAVVDKASGKAGSAFDWIEIPDLASKELSMSSLLIGEREETGQAQIASASPDRRLVDVSISRRLHRASFLRFLVFVYNAGQSPDSKKPDTAIQVQIIRDDQPVITTALRKIDSDQSTDQTRLPYAAEVALGNMPVGRYTLLVTAVDRVAKKTTSQQVRFEIVQ